jgi:BCCT, betaine/carnitine/choline family transporter
MLVARLSRGRKLYEVVMYCFVAPLIYNLVWICTWGGVGLRHTRQAKELAILGEEHYNNSGHFLVDGSEFCYHVPQESIMMNDTVIFSNHLPGVTPVCQFDDTSADVAVFKVLKAFSFPESFGNSGFGPVLSLLFVIGIAIYYLASSDGVTLIVDSLASNGRKNQHWSRRMFWACTVGALTTTLLSNGSWEVANAAIILFGLPFAVLLVFLLQSITLLCRAAEAQSEDTDYEFPDQPEFTMPVYGGIFNVMEYLLSLGKVNAARVERGQDRPTHLQLSEFVKGLVLPLVPLSQVLEAAYSQNRKTNAVVVLSYTVCHYGWIVLGLASSSRPGLAGVAWALFGSAGIILGMIRSGFRSTYNLRSNSVADFMCSLFAWPQVLTQMRLQCMAPGKKEAQEPIRIESTCADFRAEDEEEA